MHLKRLGTTGLAQKQGTNQYVYKLLQSHKTLSTWIRWSGNFYLAQKLNTSLLFRVGRCVL